jgi:hypothetical protein
VVRPGMTGTDVGGKRRSASGPAVAQQAPKRVAGAAAGDAAADSGASLRQRLLIECATPTDLLLPRLPAPCEAKLPVPHRG